VPERRFTYMDEGGMRRTLVWDEADTSWFGVFAEADMTNLARVNREQAEHESARHMTTTIARVPFTVWERAHHEGWDQGDWDKFLNDPSNRDFRVWPGAL
jgi:hypothetical protein